MKSLSIVLLLLAVAGCSPRPPSLPAETFVISAPEIVHEGSMQGTSLVLTTGRDATVSLEADGKHMSVLVTAAGKPPRQAKLVLAASTAAADPSPTDSAQVLLRIVSGGSDVGAPTIFPIPTGTKPGEFFTSSVSPGTYPLGTPLVVGTLNSKPIVLTVSGSPQ